MEGRKSGWRAAWEAAREDADRGRSPFLTWILGAENWVGMYLQGKQEELILDAEVRVRARHCQD